MQSFDQPMNAYQVPVDALNHILFNVLQAPRQLAALPAFDVTPSSLIAGIITEKGVLKAPYEAAIEKYKKELAAKSR